MGWIGRSWRGEEDLWKVFWLYGFLLNIAMAALSKSIPLFFLLYLVYLVWITVSEWRCAFNANWSGWGYIVRVWIMLPLIAVGAIIYMSIFVSSHGGLVMHG